jgi:hypothetical protein
MYNFGWAMQELLDGHAVTRAGWNGKGMCLVRIPGSHFVVTADKPFGKALPHLIGQTVEYLPHIDMLTVTGAFVPWLASQTDIQATDWIPFTRP